MNFNSIDCDCDNSFDANKNYCEYIQGNSTDLHIGPKDCEIRVDLRVNRKRSVRIWGQVKDCDTCDECYYPSKPNKPQRPKPCPPPNYPGNYKPNKPSCGFK